MARKTKSAPQDTLAEARELFLKTGEYIPGHKFKVWGFHTDRREIRDIWAELCDQHPPAYLRKHYPHGWNNLELSAK